MKKNGIFCFLLLLLGIGLFSCTNEDDLLTPQKGELDTKASRAIYYSISSFTSSNMLSAADINDVNSVLNELQGKGSYQLGNAYNSLFSKLSVDKLSYLKRGSTSSNAYGAVPAQYSASDKGITFNWNADITRQTFIEEIIHAVQDRIYYGGIGQYASRAGTPNIEFEAKLIQDIVLLINGLGFPNLGAGQTHTNEYTSWVLSIAPGSAFPSQSKVLNTRYAGYDYFAFMGFFKDKDSNYNYSVLTSLYPELISYMYSNYGIF